MPRFPNRPVTSRHNVTKMYNKFLRTGSVADGRPVTVTTQENTETVALSLSENGNQSATRLSTQLNISNGSLRHMLKRMNDKVYRPHLV